MKKLLLPLATALVILSSCSNSSSFESDVRKMARIACETLELQAKAAKGDEKAEKELEEKRKEGEEFKDKMEEKYKDDKDNEEMNKKADKIFEEELEKCQEKLKD